MKIENHKSEIIIALLLLVFGLSSNCFSVWVLPTSYDDPDNKWTNETSAYDTNLATAATYTLVSGVQHYINFFHDGVTDCNKIKLYIIPATAQTGVCDVNYNGAWHNIFTGTVTSGWHTYEIGSSQTIVGVRFKLTAFIASASLYEISFWQPSTAKPTKVANLYPANLESNKGFELLLTWSIGNLLDTDSYNVYFGTDNPPTNIVNGENKSISGTPAVEAYEVNGLSLTTYYWRVDAKNDYDVNNGDIWSFTTKADTGEDLTRCSVSHWKMNEDNADPNVYDSLGYSTGTFHGSDANTSAHHTIGRINGGLHTDGIDNYINLGDPFLSVFGAIDSPDGFTVTFWYKPDANNPGDLDEIFGLRSQTSPWNIVSIWGRTNLNYAANTSPVAGLYATESYPAVFDISKQWTMVTATITKLSPVAVRGKLYMNGVLVATSPISNQTMADYNYAFNPLIGDSDMDGVPILTEHTAGIYDDVRICKEVLTQKQIAFLYHNGEGTEELSSTNRRGIKIRKIVR
ncbi:MAG: LamG-like jellyroll fold domain-containing protein [Sedimentisphaerales bacterium]